MMDRRISNPVTGQDLLFIKTRNETNGQLLEIESTYHSKSLEPVPHYHPVQKEIFFVQKGEIKIRFSNEVITLKAGETVEIPPHKVHSMWNDTDTATVVNWKIEPALNTENFFREAFGIAQSGKVNKKGMPNLLQISLLASRYSKEFIVAKPPLFVQKIIFSILKPIALLLGYR